MTMFETFDPNTKRGHLPGWTVRPAVLADASGVARIIAQRHGVDLGEAIGKVERDLQLAAVGAADLVYLVATLADAVIGFAIARRLEPVPGDGSHNHPGGWYLMGVAVDDGYRRKGIGERLTQARIEAIARRGGREVFYFANARNESSIALHRALGFVERTRDFHVASVSFEGGEGVLFELQLP